MRLNTIWRIIKPEVAVINRSQRLKLITVNWGLDNSSYLDRAKTEFNNCFIVYLKYSKDFSKFRTCVSNFSNNINFFCSWKKIFLRSLFKVLFQSMSWVFGRRPCLIFREFFLHFLTKNVRKDGRTILLILFVFKTMASSSQHDSRRHCDMAQTRQIFFHIDSLTSFCWYECEESIFG